MKKLILIVPLLGGCATPAQVHELANTMELFETSLDAIEGAANEGAILGVGSKQTEGVIAILASVAGAFALTTKVRNGARTKRGEPV